MKDEQESFGRTSGERFPGRENDKDKVKEAHRTSTMEIVKQVGTRDLTERGSEGHLMQSFV